METERSGVGLTGGDVTALMDVKGLGRTTDLEFGPDAQKRAARFEYEAGKEQVDTVSDSGAPMQYKYDEISLAPAHHRSIVRLLFKGRNIDQIANLMQVDRRVIRKVMHHPPMTEWLERMHEQRRLLNEDLDEKKAESAVQAFEYEKGVVTGTEKPQRDRVNAAQHLMQIDPHGRFQPYDKRDLEKAPLTTDRLKDYIENARMRGTFTDVQARAADTDTPNDSPNEEQIPCP